MDTVALPDVVSFEAYRFDRRARVLSRRDEAGRYVPVRAGSRAMEVFAVLIDQPGEIVSKDDLMRAVWPGTVVEDANLAVQISNLRRILDENADGASHIQTVPGRGYRFVPVVAEVVGPEPPAEETAAAPKPVRGITVARLRPRLMSALFAVSVLVAGVAGWMVMHSRMEAARDPGRLAIVVLPFANLNGEAEQNYFVDAITSNLTTDLSRVSGVSVIAFSSAATYRDKTLDARRIGQELGVGYVLEGSVQRFTENVEVNARLVNAGSGTLIWADRFETPRRNLPLMEAEITGRLAHALNRQLVEAAAADRVHDVDPDAGDLMMRGWAAWFRPFSLANRREALSDFEQALEKDPRSTDARIGIGTILVTNIGTGLSRDPDGDAARVERLIREALEADPNSSAAHTVLGTLRRWQNRLEESRSEQEAAVKLDRNNVHAMLQLAQALMYLGQPAAALPYLDATERLNPRDPNAAWADWTRGACELLLGHVDAAATLLRKARNQNPRVFYFQLWLAGALGAHGDTDEARAALAEAGRLDARVVSFSGWRVVQPWITHPAFEAIVDKTMATGLRRAGMAD